MKVSNNSRTVSVNLGLISATLLLSNAVSGGSAFAASLMTPEDLGVASQVAAAPYALSKAGFEKASKDASPEQLARAFLARQAQQLGLRSDLSDLKLVAIQNSPVGSVVRFEQTVNGASVDSSDLVITVSQGEVITFINNYSKIETSRYEKSSSTPKASLSKEWAMQKAYSELALTSSPTFQSIEEKVSIVNGQARPVYVVSLAAPADRKYGWELVLDADSGAVIRSKDMTYHAGINTAVFDPNPTIKTGKAYGSVAGFTDANNADSAFFKSLYTPVTLDNLTTKNGKTILAGPNVVITDNELPKNPNCDVKSTTTSWNYTRNSPCFDAVNAYYFVDKSLKYLNGTLGFNAHPLKYTGGIKVDPRGVNGDDNSHYVGTTDTLSLGEGGIDDAQDHDVIIHELGHAIHNWLTNGHLSQVEGLSEGIGDYWAASYDRQFMKPTDLAYNWTFSFDGHNEFWDGRVVNLPGKYPAAIQGNANVSEIHNAGQMWATVCIEIYDAIGKAKADKLFWSGISMLSDNSNQNDAAKAYVAAARKIYPTDANLISTVVGKFQARGYTVQ